MRAWLFAFLALVGLLAACFPGALTGRVAIDGAPRLTYIDPLYTPSVPRPANPLQDPSTETLHQPWDAWIMRKMRAGELPLWLPDNGFGAPVLANGQSAPFSPYKWLTLPFSDGRWTVWFVLGRLLLAGAGVLALAAYLGLSPAAGLLGAAAFMLHAFFLHHLRLPDVHVYAFMPWLLLAAERLYRRPDARGVGLMGLAIGVTGLLGHPEPALYAAAGAGAVYATVSLVGREGLGRRALAMSLAVMLGALLTMAIILPFIAFVRESSSYLFGERTGSGITFKHMLVFALGHLLIPEGPRAAYNPYVGVAPLMLALLGLLHAEVRQRALALIGVGIFAYLAFPPANLLPALPISPNSFYAPPLIALGLALLAAAGLDKLVAAPRARAALVVGLAAGLWAIGVLRYQWLAPFKTFGDLSPALPYLLAVAALLLAQRLRAWPRPLIIASLLALAAIDLSRSVQLVVRPLPPFDYPETPIIRYLKAQPGLFRVAGWGLLPDTNLLHGITSASHHDAFFFRRYLDYWTAMAKPDTTRGYQPELLDLANVRYLLVPDREEAVGLRAQVAAAPARYPARLRQPGVTLHENASVLPRARVLHAARFVPLGSAAAGEQLRATPGAWRHAALVETPDGRPPAGWRDRPGPATEVKVVAYEDQRVELATHPGQPGILVLADTYAGGWEAEVDGRPAAILPVDVAFRGVLLEAGAHRIVFRYQPRSVSIGLGISLLTLLLCLALLVRPQRRRFKPPGEPA